MTVRANFNDLGIFPGRLADALTFVRERAPLIVANETVHGSA